MRRSERKFGAVQAVAITGLCLAGIVAGAWVVAGGDGPGECVGCGTARCARSALWGSACESAAESPTASRIRSAIERGRRYFGTHVDVADPSWISLFGYMRRRFGFEVSLASGEKAHAVRGDTARPEMFEVFRRIDDPDAAIAKQTIADLPHVIDRITASALHCDRIDLPDDWIEILGKASRAGGYALTHALLASEWSVENGCVRRERLAALRSEQIGLLVALVERRDELASTYPSVTDLWIEAVVMLYYAGAADAVQPDWIREILTLQHADGGWPRNPSVPRSDAHVSALALWALLENDRVPLRTPWIEPAVGPDSRTEKGRNAR